MKKFGSFHIMLLEEMNDDSINSSGVMHDAEVVLSIYFESDRGRSGAAAAEP